MNRRRVLQACGVAAAALFSSGHTPYGQWVVYRKKHLLIGCHKQDPVTYDLGKQVVERLSTHLPEAKSRVARAPDAGRLASLLGTGQMDVAVLSREDSGAMRKGAGAFKAYGSVELRMLMPVGSRILIAREDFPDKHAWLVAGALAGSDLAPAPQRQSPGGIPWHPGSMAFLEGRPEPGYSR